VKRLSNRTRAFFWLMAAAASLALIWQIYIYCSVPHRSYDEIRRELTGKSAAETLLLLGEPDTRQEVFGGDVRWIWWSRAVLDGPSQPPELRGQVVHLHIVFHNTGKRTSAAADWKIDDALGVGYWLPGETKGLFD